MPHLTTIQWVTAALAALCIGLGKAGFNGIGTFAILLMTQVLPAKQSTGLILPMLIIADIVAVTSYRKFAVWHHVFRLLPAAFVGIVTGWLLMPHIPGEVFGHFIGWLTLALLALIFVQKAQRDFAERVASHPAVELPMGWLAGTTTMLANAAGPVMTIYLLACRLPKLEFVGTAAWFFFIVNVLKVPFSASLGLINGPSLSLNLWLAPLVIGGVFLGRWLLYRIKQGLFEFLLLAFTLLGALRLILQ